MAKPQMSLKARALRYLSMREHSRLELGRKLERHAQEGDNVDLLLDQLEAAKFLSQDRFAESLVRRRSARFGNSRILLELQSHGIDARTLTEDQGELMKDEGQRASVGPCAKVRQATVGRCRARQIHAFLATARFFASGNSSCLEKPCGRRRNLILRLRAAISF